MPFNLGSFAPLEGLLQSDKLLQQRQYNEILKQQAQQQLQKQQQDQAALSFTGRVLPQIPQMDPQMGIPQQGIGGQPVPPPQQGAGVMGQPYGQNQAGLTPGDPGAVKASWFGNAPGWRDPSDSGLQAGGQPVSAGPGIALPNRGTLGQQFDVTAPSGKTMTLPQTDIGPAARTGRGVDINAPAAEAFGYTPQNFPTDSQFVVRAHRQLDVQLDQSGGKMIQAGVPGPVVQDTTKTAMNVGREFNPLEWGRLTQKQIIDTIERVGPNEPDAVKALTFMQLNKLMAPEEKMAAQIWAKQNQQDLQLTLEKMREGSRESLEQTREQFRRENPPLTPFQTDKGPMSFNPRSNTMQPILGQGGQPFEGKLTKPGSEPRNAPAIALRTFMEEFQAENGRPPSSAEVRNFQAAQTEAVSEARTVGTASANMERASNAAAALIPLVRETSAKISRTDYPDVNSLILAYETKTGGTDVVQYGEMVNSLRYLYARALAPSGQGPRVADINHFDEIFNKAWSKGQVGAALDQIERAIKIEKGATEKTKDEILGRTPKAAPSAPAASAGTALPGAKDIKPGYIENGYRFEGGDPLNRESWVPATTPPQ